MPEQRLGLSQLFPSIACETLFLPATARSALHDLGAVDPTTGLTPGPSQTRLTRLID